MNMIEMTTRPRRLRTTETLRAMVRETRVSADSLIYPMFVMDGENTVEEIPSMPGQYRYTVDRMDEELDRLQEAGVKSLMLFGIPAVKDETGSQAYADDGIVQRALRRGKEQYPDLFFITDVCMCEYTSHGHCGVVCDGEILNDDTLPLLSKMAVSLADAGADIIAPSDMMDGRVAAIRKALDGSGHINTPIMSYSAKFASGYYSPFRDAAQSAPAFGDRRTYQMSCTNGREALREIEDDIDEGADIVMVKPALAYLDIVRAARDRYDLPIAAYNVSGEYSMVKAAAQNGWIDEKRIVLENLTAIKRSGADIIITYHALDAAEWLEEK